MAEFFASAFWIGFLWPLIVMVAQSLLLRHGGRDQAANQLIQAILGSMRTPDGRNLMSVLAKFPARKPGRPH